MAVLAAGAWVDRLDPITRAAEVWGIGRVDPIIRAISSEAKKPFLRSLRWSGDIRILSDIAAFVRACNI